MQQRTVNRLGREANLSLNYWNSACRDLECNAPKQQPYIGYDQDTVTMYDSAIWTHIDVSRSLASNESTTGSEFYVNQWKLQGGVEGTLHEDSKDNRLAFGIHGFYGAASLDVSSHYGDGSIDTAGYGIGASLSWLQNNGQYVDFQAQYSWYTSDLFSDKLGSLNGSVSGTGYVLSTEFGKKLEWQNDWSVTPQAQFTLASIDTDSLLGSYGENVYLDNADSLKLRLGVSADREKSWIDEKGMKQHSTFHVIANAIHEFDGRTAVNISGKKLENQSNAWNGQLGFGVTRSFNNDKYTVFGQVDAETNLNNIGDSYRLGLNLGAKIKF